ncbi:MAG: hypothetical protein J2P52_00225, partial [Blastocatellia bacterium]|nr:hypothetical protein [Blastocatellia bacterium]
AGVYWQLLAGTLALLAWLALAPYTPLADLAFCFFLGSVVDIAFNANPLIKLDGYYFLSQWLRLPNLMDRACEWRRGFWRRVVFGERNEAAARFNRREQAILAVFGLLSFIYTVALRLFIVILVSSYLIDWRPLPGLLLTLALALFYARRRLRQSVEAAISALRGMVAGAKRLFTMRPVQMETNMTVQDQIAQTSSSRDSGKSGGGREPSRWRRRLGPLAIALFIILILCMAWNASVGAYGIPHRVPHCARRRQPCRRRHRRARHILSGGHRCSAIRGGVAPGQDLGGRFATRPDTQALRGRHCAAKRAGKG